MATAPILERQVVSPDARRQPFASDSFDRNIQMRRTNGSDSAHRRDDSSLRRNPVVCSNATRLRIVVRDDLPFASRTYVAICVTFCGPLASNASTTSWEIGSVSPGSTAFIEIAPLRSKASISGPLFVGTMAVRTCESSWRYLRRSALCSVSIAQGIMGRFWRGCHS